MNRRRPASKKSSSGLRATEIPGHIELQLATLRKCPPAGPGWLHEIKLDGYRMLCRIDGGRVQLITRGQLDWTNRLSHLAADLLKLPVKSAWLDGEVVALRADGISDFSTLQSAFRKKTTSQLIYSVFDLLYVDGYDVRSCALLERKRMLAGILKKPPARVQYVDHVEGRGAEFFEQCGNMGLEGMVCKRMERAHRPGRSDDWIKVKCNRREDFVICGYIDPISRRGLGSLIVGSYRPDGRLIYDGSVGSGISAKLEAELLLKLARISATKAPLAKAPREGRQRMHWVRPELVARVEFRERSGDGMLRHPTFQGLREDVAPSSVVRIPEVEAGDC
jgi:bifunctional non-homologous end joining protein LigD